jgi:non-heme chloroperoxidase
MNHLKFYPAFFGVFLLISCSSKTEILPEHEVKFITNNGVKLEVLDWGGEGSPILFLAGLGNSAHVFDDFAPGFTNKFHVYALTRRGFGASTQPSGGYDIKTLSEDIRSVLDSLHIKKAILIGHSIAGEEISRFASTYPDRVNKIIYLDAAYDRTGMSELLTILPDVPKPTAKDSSSFVSLKRFMHRMNGIDMPDEEIRQTSVFSKEGKFLKDVTADTLVGKFFGAVEKPDYKRIKCPALALYSIPASVSVVLPFYGELDSLNKKKADRLFLLMSKLAVQNQNNFKKEVQNGSVLEIKGPHYLFLSNTDETEKAIRDFIE